jgi:hypothetical protein
MPANSTSSAIDTNIDSLSPKDQARTSIETTGSTTTITVTGGPLSGLEVTTSPEAPNLVLNGSFKDGIFNGGGTYTEFFTVTSGGSSNQSASLGKDNSGNKVIKSRFNLGDDNFKDTVNFGKKASAKKVTLSDFGDNDKLKYKGKTYTADDIVGNRFAGLSPKQIKLA